MSGKIYTVISCLALFGMSLSVDSLERPIPTPKQVCTCSCVYDEAPIYEYDNLRSL